MLVMNFNLSNDGVIDITGSLNFGQFAERINISEFTISTMQISFNCGTCNCNRLHFLDPDRL